jgi:hypothetical protein
MIDAHIRWTEELYLEWVNNYLSLNTFAEYYSLTRWEALRVINAGRIINQQEDTDE